MRTIIDQPYAVSNGTQLRFDLFAPESEVALPLVVCIHGGGWISGSKEEYAEVAQALVHHGFAAAVPDYRLAPLHPCPAALDDVRRFVRFAKDNALGLGIDGSRIGSFGNSAGGHLASILGLSSDPDERVGAVVAICPITDLTSPHEHHFPIAWSFLEQFLGPSWEEDQELHRFASPLWQISSDAPPFLIYHGSEDDIVPFAQAEVFADALRSAGVSAEFHPLEGESHGISFESWQRILSRSASFYQEVLH